MNPPSNRARITDRVAGLLGEQPWPAYDEQAADDIMTRLDAGTADAARQVRSYERGRKDRPEIVEAADRRIERS